MFANPSIGIAPGRGGATIVGVAGRVAPVPGASAKAALNADPERLAGARQVTPCGAEWNTHAFAQEQIKTLVRRIFFRASGSPVKQVVFSAASSNLDIGNICRQVGHALASETQSDISIVIRERQDPHSGPPTEPSAKNASTRIGSNLWQLAEFERAETSDNGSGRYWLSRLAELRSEFEYSVIEGPVAGLSNEASLLAELADGIVLVLAAHRTRKASIRQIRDALQAGQSRILGTVLSERTFPIPERIYRRL